ncbi:hypothetical protein GWK47_028826 [Chionoecetes opilio]|uniref:Uncharacterized protein n=1 Tax=Chionoecetes opilio TaxID=41210 RepID=A0A8J5CRU2_CHIOP|nr:hypothetical protein GWK47_028826 [Chionoecetes opilio]
MWLLDKIPEPDTLGARLPSREQVFLFFMYQHHVLKKTVPDSVSATSEKLKAIWGKAKLTTKTDANIRKNVKNLFEEYQALKKDRNRITDGAELKRKIWKGDLEDLFDISSAYVLERRDILDEDKSFLISQREGRSSSSMAGVDVAEVAKEKKKKEAAKKLENRKRKQEAETERLLEKVPYPRSGLSSSSNTSSEDEDGDFKAPATKLPRRAPTNKLSLNIELTSAWDREGLSNFEEILGVPVAQDRTGQEVARTVFQEVERVGARELIIGLSFDTTASNSGMLAVHACTCVHLENLLGRSLLWLACRHHVLEVVLKHVFEKCCGPSTGPEIPTFKRFQSRWESLDRGSYHTLNDEEPLENALDLPRVQMVTFLQTVLHDGSNPREDYDELLRLCLLFLGGSEGQIRFRAPGAYHQARWMVKMTLFADQLELPARIQRGLRQVALFVSLLYIKHWHEALIPEYAPKNDLELLQTLNEYPDKEVGAEGTRALSRHLWYLSDDLIALGFFDDRVEDGEKKRMLENLVRPASKALKRLEGKGLKVTNTTTLSGFVASSSKRLFELLTDRKEHPQNLLADEALKNRVRALKVVNDNAERAIALIKQFAGAVKDEGQRQYLLRVIKHHRSEVPKRTKAACSAFSL